MIFLLLFVVVCGALADTEELYYDNYSGELLTDEEYRTYVERNITFWCTGKFRDCDPTEGRRLDQTCTNLQYPTRGTSRSPYVRALPPRWGENFEPARKVNGEEMAPARRVRTEALSEGDVPDPRLNFLATHFMLFVLATQTSFHDTINYLQWTPNCCMPSGQNEPQCAPLKVPEDDPVHKWSGIRCLNQTKPLTFQTVGCSRADDAPYPERINSATNFFDLAMIYGPDDSHRSFEDGMLKVDVEEDGKVWPYQAEVGTGNCIQNAMPEETRCHKQSAINALPGVNLLGIQFWRQHNHFARELKKVNPCWDDQKLFDVAREMNIASLCQILFYELLPVFMGRQRLVNDGVIGKDGGFRKVFRENITPQMYIEYPYLWRWGHTIMPGIVNLYDPEGNIFGEIPSTNLTLRTGWLAKGNRLEGMTQGAIRQPNAKADQVVDPIISNTGLGNLQRSVDLTTSDLSKGGLQGIANYVAFREHCTGRKIETFEDLLEDVSPENIDKMRYSHEDVRDVPALLGVWLEKPIPGGIVPRTLYCISAPQYKRFMQTDRHWYEDPDRPNAFTRSQLREIRKMTIARTFCDVADTVTKIMPQAFLRESPSNPMVDCDRIRRVNFDAWREC